MTDNVIEIDTVTASQMRCSGRRAACHGLLMPPPPRACHADADGGAAARRHDAATLPCSRSLWLPSFTILQLPLVLLRFACRYAYYRANLS